MQTYTPLNWWLLKFYQITYKRRIITSTFYVVRDSPVEWWGIQSTPTVQILADLCVGDFTSCIYKGSSPLMCVGSFFSLLVHVVSHGRAPWLVKKKTNRCDWWKYDFSWDCFSIASSRVNVSVEEEIFSQVYHLHTKNPRSAWLAEICILPNPLDF